ncbi:MipA/OmpV family protein [Acinetobacter pittii]|uniref:MipA/OmpV family protein n=1 Tax=Acinetobacter pittii TaxID=48296 RepID=UPI001ABFD993|nr:MipA/OmpV family protein [Acinetobacter pittii]QDB81935.1 MipA/OmpV family protein [Acinetobacter pittii]
MSIHISPLIEIRITKFSLYCISILLISSNAIAETSSITEKESKFGLGLGAALVQKPYQDIDTEVLPIPIISYENRWIDISPPRADFKINSNDKFSMRLRARYAGDGYDSDDSPYLQGMAERKSSIWAGGAVVYNSNIAQVSVEALTDVSEYSKGSRAKLIIEKRFQYNSLGFTPRIGAEWLDDKFIDYYYGVDASEVRVGRNLYDGKATTNIDVGVRLDYRPSQHHIFFMDAGTTILGSSIKESPLVDKSAQTIYSLGYVYRF